MLPVHLWAESPGFGNLSPKLVYAVTQPARARTGQAFQIQAVCDEVATYMFYLCVVLFRHKAKGGFWFYSNWSALKRGAQLCILLPFCQFAPFPQPSANAGWEYVVEVIVHPKEGLVPFFCAP